MHGVTQKISAAYEVAAELCLLSQVIIYKPVPVDVASTLEVNHVKLVCYVTDSCDWLYLVAICYLLHECRISVSNCLYVLIQLQHYRRLKVSLNVSSVCI